MKQLNPEHIDALLEFINCGPYFELLEINVRELGMGYSKVEVDLQRKHLNTFGAIHGGVYSSIIDTAAYWSIYCELDENIGFTSIDLSVSNFAMIREGKIIVEGKSIKIGRSICLAEADAKDINGKLLAHGTSKLMILNEKQSIEHAIEAMGYRTLPPKFID
ncbi:MAG: PaaI family thioesterase [Firmicutes bacterium]|nr:PaaI family thioesterase [Bacillota bacterium]